MDQIDPAAREVIEVGHGEYVDYQTLALFTDASDAAAFVDHFNLTHIDEISRGSILPAHIAGTQPLYEAGRWRPRSTEVVDGDLVDDHNAIGH